MTPVVYSVIATYLGLGIIYFGLRKKDYSHLKHTISELGENGSRDEMRVGYGLFLPVGIGVLIPALLFSTNNIISGVSFSISIGYLIAAFFPCDPGSPTSGSWKQQVHNLGGFVEYVGSIYFLMKSEGTGLTIFSISIKSLAFIVLGCTVALSIPGFKWRGLAQRLAELLLFSCLILFSR